MKELMWEAKLNILCQCSIETYNCEWEFPSVGVTGTRGHGFRIKWAYVSSEFSTTERCGARVTEYRDLSRKRVQEYGKLQVSNNFHAQPQTSNVLIKVTLDE